MLTRSKTRTFLAHLSMCCALTASSAFAALPVTSSATPQNASQAGAEGKQQTWTGEITTAMCKGTKSSMGHDCILNCVKTGEKLVLFTKGQPQPIANQDFADLKEHAGHHVRLTGSLGPDGKSITVTKIEMPHSAQGAHHSASQ